MASPIKTNKTELSLAKSLPVDEWFTIYDSRIKLQPRNANRLIKRFLCVEKTHKARMMYRISSEHKERLIECIKLNPKAKEFDITRVEECCDDMWHKLLGTKQGMKHEGTNQKSTKL